LDSTHSQTRPARRWDVKARLLFGAFEGLLDHVVLRDRDRHVASRALLEGRDPTVAAPQLLRETTLASMLLVLFLISS
jgi:hypothetical protein